MSAARVVAAMYSPAQAEHDHTLRLRGRERARRFTLACDLCGRVEQAVDYRDAYNGRYAVIEYRCERCES